ncbi:MAG: hypothetical protein AB7P00_24470 [Sandaracinaceae bacterium]
MRLALLSLASMALGGCFVVDDAHLRELMNGGDAGRDGGGGSDGGGDAGGGGNILNEACGGPIADYFVIRNTMTDIHLDTRGLGNSVRSRCGVAMTGPNGFLALETQAGQQWHFHVQAQAGDLDPLIYLLDSTCDARDCAFNGNYCSGMANDEHFAFIAPNDGIYYLGIDDGVNAQGGEYTLGAYLITCGDGEKTHGEPCDLSAAGGNCNARCHPDLGTATVEAEIEANDSIVEANHVVLPASNSFEFSGSLTPDGCTYPDVYSFEVRTDNSMVSVVALDTAGDPCAASSLTDAFTLTIRNGENGTVIAPTSEVGTGCAIIEPRALNSGTYYLWVDYTAPLTDRPAGYNLRLTVAP